MILPDVNVLLYAFRTDSHQHDEYRGWLEEVVNGEAAYGMAPQVLANLIRITTHPRIFVRPSRREDVIAFATLLLQQPHCDHVEPARATGGCFAIFARKPTPPGIWCRMPGLPHWRSRQDANG